MKTCSKQYILKALAKQEDFVFRSDKNESLIVA